SPSLPRQALADALALARQIGAPVEVVTTQELQNPEYSSNPVNRCYFCKAELFRQMERLAADRKYRAIAYGENADDMRQVRPGRQAATEYQVLAPLRDAGLTKAEIRELSRELGLPTADAPAQPCLSSRIPHGTPVTLEALAMVEQGEAWVRSLGFRVFRVRHLAQEGQPTRARVLVAPEEMGRLEEVQAEIVGGLKAVGYAEVEIDPEGYRSAA
ncbi:MAG: ATP-dependent sacrificial sulfur transferase LarE, partial [Chthoniobacteraceae bacterium]